MENFTFKLKELKKAKKIAVTNLKKCYKDIGIAEANIRNLQNVINEKLFRKKYVGRYFCRTQNDYKVCIKVVSVLNVNNRIIYKVIMFGVEPSKFEKKKKFFICDELIEIDFAELIEYFSITETKYRQCYQMISNQVENLNMLQEEEEDLIKN